MAFCFINNNTPLDRPSQKLIRSHAMKGKNLGKTIAARGHQRQPYGGSESRSSQAQAQVDALRHIERGRQLLPKTLEPDSRSTSASPEHVPWMPWMPCVPLVQNHFSGAELSYFVTPELFTPSSRYLVHEFHYVISQTLYPRVFCRPSREAETSWFELMVANPCVFHCVLAMAGAHISRHLDERKASLESTRHFMEAMRLLRCELSANPEPQDTSLAVIVSLAIHASLTGDAHQSRIHLHGLKHIVELRPGGLSALCTDAPEVGNKVRRADLNFALAAGTTTLFGSRSSPLPTTPYVVPLVGQRSNVTLPHPLGDISPPLQSAARDIMALCSYAGSSQLGAFQYQDLVISIYQRLVDYCPLVGPRPLCLLDDICQLGLLCFMSTVIHHDEHGRPAAFASLSEAFRTRLDGFDADIVPSQANGCYSLFLWLTFIYAITVPDHEDFYKAGSFVSRRIRALTSTLVLKSWEDATAHLSLYPWITAFHDRPSRKIWARVNCM